MHVEITDKELQRLKNTPGRECHVPVAFVSIDHRVLHKCLVKCKVTDKCITNIETIRWTTDEDVVLAGMVFCVGEPSIFISGIMPISGSPCYELEADNTIIVDKFGLVLQVSTHIVVEP